MVNDFNVKLAGIAIGISSESGFMENFCRDYFCEDSPVFSVSATEEEISKEMNNSSVSLSRDYAEALCIHRTIAEKMPEYNRVVFHGAAVEYGGKAYIFTAPPGTGKTTHIRLWKKYLGDSVRVINGDKPILSLSGETITVHGTPYAGKENYQNNISVPLGGICILSQGRVNVINPVTPAKAFTSLYLQTYKPYNEDAMRKTIEFVRVLCTVPCFSLSCDMSEQAVRLSFEALTKKDYQPVKY